MCKKINNYKLFMVIIVSILLLTLSSCGLFSNSKDDGEDNTDDNITENINTKNNNEKLTTEPIFTSEDEEEFTEETEEYKFPGKDLNLIGTIKSEDNNLIKLHIDWEAKQVKEGEYADVKITLYLDCYSIIIGERNNNKIIIDNEEIEFSTPRLENDSDKISSIEIYSTTKQILSLSDMDTVIDISAQFYFGGSYGGNTIGWIEVSGEILLKYDETINTNPLVPELPDNAFEPIINIR